MSIINDIKLRFLEYSDLDNLLKIENDERFWHLSGVTEPFLREDLSNYITNSKADISEFGQLRLVIECNSKLIGLIDLYDYNQKEKKAGVGIIVLDKFQEKGVASQSLELLKIYAKDKLKIATLFAIIELDNTKSIRLFEKADFVEYELLPHYLKKNSSMVDCKKYDCRL